MSPFCGDRSSPSTTSDAGQTSVAVVVTVVIGAAHVVVVVVVVAVGILLNSSCCILEVGDDGLCVVRIDGERERDFRRLNDDERRAPVSGCKWVDN